ncbi:formate dehydrogenase subunit gamma [Sulfitobacter donghicola]|uniref:Formate dehydrogenase subunit gamma n=1 Tax=Sulfitobacter donghicola DSW-25 = KCTC 12864 = JCM 14565 TaxID=1300350 RepID=A0A073IFX0_9RHOB|nr:formate dehydrogenase subunit gamma [Sulfitobacter donghicola]KEJ88644.1 formate dehydrogenase subunit gamma [Sulfitobacter donghicola DSW-25 = KCTC 12864 = JCM 14565]KIN68412.1 Formate dehydrogenase, gamma subunit [Sulfitobacter donghicola DSW-25 = KCTC 12864 = JCM 14565]
MFRLLSAFVFFIALALPSFAQEAGSTVTPDRSATGGAQTLDDILARQRGESIDDSFRRDATGDPDSAAGIAEQLGTLGGASDPELWRALRFGTADITVSTADERGKVLVQDGGMWWLEFREGPLTYYGLWLLAGTLIALALFYILRGKIRIDSDLKGRTIERFKFIERMAHWTLAGSFILLGLTGLLVLIGRKFLAPTFGLEANATVLMFSKFIHNNVSWAFMLSLIIVFVMWVWHNIPDRTDLVWIKQAGGIVGSKHPPAKKFNFGQKIIFWSVIVLGGSVSVSGLSLLFPYEITLFAKTFGILNDMGLTALFGFDALPTQLSPQEEMQYGQLWHAIVAFVMMSIILAHIYIGSVGMEGASSAMTSGEVDEAWAEQHHSIWLEEVKAKQMAEQNNSATPAE